jgi:hypothetical protein
LTRRRCSAAFRRVGAAVGEGLNVGRGGERRAARGVAGRAIGVALGGAGVAIALTEGGDVAGGGATARRVGARSDGTIVRGGPGGGGTEFGRGCAAVRSA